ncbi:DUF4197 domain-containing protein [Aliikangiella coralliicola]|uniref:DUF4197 domain-containing protein n=1 Tax=Aliikangiella coralliicola TaxID=2592383 RepID=A0A545UF46_9GAMM|nr:DUF4197 domain-containing protein [Aliikangiella coralliicola]TQV88101.1 DUF4197 domain-containing protein [Aliikangiella coralliicola]
MVRYFLFILRLVKKSFCLSTLFVLPIAFGLTGCKNVDLQQVADTLQQYQTPLDEKTVVAGLKQALEVGTNNSVSKTSQIGGFSNNPLIRIAVPKELDKTASTLRKFGLGRYVDKFELQMNRSAESASKEAKQVFLESIAQMTLTDAWNILRGPNDAATQYFRRTTEARLSTKFKPIISSSMNKVGFYQDYKSLLNAYDALPLTTKPDLNIENYILQSSLDGLFKLVAQEEGKIRQDPAARVTELLQRVFAK